MRSNLKLAFRQLARSPGFAAVSIVTLALGIGACAAMFSIVDAVILKPLPFRQPDRLVWIENTLGPGLSERTTRVDTFTGWRDQNRSFEALAAYFAFFDYGRLTMSGAGDLERLSGVGVSDNFLPVLGVPLLYGRNFTPEECAWEGPGAAILSHAFWKRRFAGDPSVVGRTITLDKKPTAIVGILPSTFDFASIFSPGSEIELLTPFPMTPETARWGNTLFGIGRLRPGVTLDRAQADLSVISGRLRRTIAQGPFGAAVQPLGRALRGKFRAAFLLLAGAVACVLAIACVNLSNLLLARVNVRRHEFGVRVALGARRRHLVLQALTESLLLAGAGSILGVPLAMWATRTIAHLRTFGVPFLGNARVDPVALGVTVALTATTGLACGLLPALHLSRGQRTPLLRNATRQRSQGRSAAGVRDSLVVAEVALACVLLVGAGLLLRSFAALLHVDLGFEPRHAMVWRVDPQRGFASGAEVDSYLGDAVRRIAALPGVEAVGLSDTLPLGRNRSWGAGAVGVQYPAGEVPIAYPRIVSPGYLRAMGIPLISGRHFEDSFDPQAGKAVLVNQAFARRLWPGRNPLGRKIDVNGGSTVIGVVGDVRHASLEEAGGNEMYLDFRQSGDWSAMEMVVRSALPPRSLVPEVRTALAAYDPSLASGEFYELERLVDDAVAPRRLILELLGAFSTLALGLAGLGIYGVVAFAVVQRTQEIGVRMAVGARRRDVLRLVVGGGLKLVAIGVALGLVGALALTRVLQSLLYDVSAYDPLVFGGNAALLLTAATLACLLPALRASRVDPMVALRTD
jgi:putative ABC transport system permease protein